MRRLAFCLLAVLSWSGPLLGQFNHPGPLHSRRDLERIERMVSQGIGPWRSRFEVFRADAFLQLNIYPDSDQVQTKTAGTRLRVPLKAGGGQAIWLEAVDVQ